MIKSLIIIFFVVFYTTGGFGQDDSEIINFESECLEILTQNEATYIDSLNIHKSKTKLTIDFLANVNCAQDNKGRIWISSDTLYIMDNDVKVVIDHKDSTTVEGQKIEIIEETKIKEFAFCTCKMHYHYELSDPISDFRFFNFNGRLRRL